MCTQMEELFNAFMKSIIIGGILPVFGREKIR
jgi:hypothetical protein